MKTNIYSVYKFCCVKNVNPYNFEIGKKLTAYLYAYKSNVNYRELLQKILRNNNITIEK